MHESRTRLELEQSPWRSRDQHSVGGRPREGKDSDSRDSRNTLILLIF